MFRGISKWGSKVHKIAHRQHINEKTETIQEDGFAVRGAIKAWPDDLIEP